MTETPPTADWPNRLLTLESEVAALRQRETRSAKSRTRERTIALLFAVAMVFCVAYIKFYEISDTVNDMVGPPVMDIIQQGKQRADEILESKLIFAHDRVALKFEFGDRAWLARGVLGEAGTNGILAAGQEVTDGFPTTYEGFDSDVRMEIIKVPIRKK